MMHKNIRPKATVERSVQRFEDGESFGKKDTLAIEDALELRENGKAIAVLMRTPGHDTELVQGFLRSEGVLRSNEEFSLSLVEKNVVELEMDKRIFEERWVERKLPSSSACGVCGLNTIAHMEDFARPVRSALRWSSTMVLSVPSLLRKHQYIFNETGALHAAALLNSDGQLLVCREDVGRHNAVDKVVGWMLENDRIALDSCVLGVSGRLSFEIVQKAIVAGVPMIVGISAPSSLAVDLAERWRVTLAGFVREKSFNVYSHHSRIYK